MARAKSIEGVLPRFASRRVGTTATRRPRSAIRALRGPCGPCCEPLEERRLLAAVVSSTVFVPGKVSGLGVSGVDLLNGLVPAPGDTNYYPTNEGGPISNLTD